MFFVCNVGLIIFWRQMVQKEGVFMEWQIVELKGEDAPTIG